MSEAVGPVFTGGFQHVKLGAYELLYLPDLHNDQLQREGKAPVYYWMPAYVRIARMNVDTGPAKFHMVHFVGVQNAKTTVGAAGAREIAGGVVTFTTTAAPPAGELQASQEELMKRFRGNDDKFWGWRTSVAPAFRPMPVMACSTSLTNLSPNARGAVPTSASLRGASNGSIREFRMGASLPPMDMSRTVREGDVNTTGGVDPWYVNLQGQGEGSINLLGETGYSGLLGSYPAAILWASFHGGTGAIVARQDFKLKFWAPMVTIHIHGNWDVIYKHFSTATSAKAWWVSADIQTEVNNMRANGSLDVSITIDPTIPGADKMQADIDKKTDLVLQKFMEQAQKMIFEPAPPSVTPAQAKAGDGKFGLAFALKYRRDTKKLDLRYDEKREMAYIQNHTISSSLSGFQDEIKADPEAEKRYFSTLYLEQWDSKVSRTVKPVVNWPDPARQWVGEPVAFLSVQVGYPNTDGVLQWDGGTFQATDPADRVIQTANARKPLADVKNPPAGWQSDITYIKRKIHFTEPPDESAYPHARVFVEQNEVDLDPGPNGTPTNELNLEVRADSAGKLDVGPISLNVDLETPKQVVEVAFQCLGKTLTGADRPITRFQWLFADQAESRYWAIYTGQLDFVPRYRYQVRVIQKGSITSKGMEWTGPWVETNGNGPLMITVPTPEDEGATIKRDFPMAATEGSPVATEATLPPPPTSSPAASAGGDSLPPPPRTSAVVEAVNPLGVRGYALTPTTAAVAGSETVVTRAGGREPAEKRSEPVVEGWTTRDPAHRWDD